MAIIPAREAHLTRSNPTRYQEGVFFLARLVKECLSYAFFYHRLIDQMRSGDLQGVEYEQARFSSFAIHDSIIVIFHKLVEGRRDSWNLRQLHKEWCKYQQDKTAQQSVLDLIKALEQKLQPLVDYRHDKVAHESKSVKMTMLTSLPDRIGHLESIVTVVDQFVDGDISYSLYLHESGEEINLRNALDI